MKPWAKATLQGATCGLMLGVVLLIGGRLWQPQVAAAQEKSSAVPDVVKARRFEVVDPAGKTWTVVGPSYLWLYDAAGNLSMSLTTDAGMPGLWLFDATMLRAILGLTAEGSPSLEFWDKNRKLRAVVGAAHFETEKTKDVTMTSESTLVLFDKDGKVMWKAP